MQGLNSLRKPRSHIHSKSKGYRSDQIIHSLTIATILQGYPEDICNHLVLQIGRAQGKLENARHYDHSRLSRRHYNSHL